MKKGLLLIMLLLPVMIWSQEITFKDEEQDLPKAGFSLGKFVFAPSIEVLYEFKDNIFLTEFNEVSDELLTVRPRLVLELPKEDSYFRLGWLPQYRKFKDYDLDQQWTNFFNLMGKIKTSGGLELKFLDDYTYKGALEVSQIDPGQELLFYSTPFNRNYFQFDMNYFFNDTNGFGLSADRIDLDTDCTHCEALWYDYVHSFYGASYQRYMNPLLRMALGVNLVQFDPENTLATRGYDGFEYFLRFYGDLSPTVNATIRVGYQDLSYDYSDYNYKDWDAEAQFLWNFVNDDNLTVTAARTVNASNYQEAISFTSNTVRLTYNFRPSRKLFAAVGGTAGRNDYNFFSRTDDTWNVYGNIGYHFGQLTSLRVNLVHEERTSTEDSAACWQGCDYTSNTILLNFIMGY